MAADKELFLVAQLDPSEDDPDRDALYDLGVIATAMQLLKLPDGTVRVLVEGVKRARLVNLVDRDGYHGGRDRGSRRGGDRRSGGAGADALGHRPVRELRQAQQAASARNRDPAVAKSRMPSVLADAVASNLSIKVADKQALLGELNPVAPAGDGVCLHGRRARRAPGREEDPQPRQTADGEDPARILSERAIEGDPARARQ